MAEYESQNCPSEEAKDDYPCYGYECYDRGNFHVGCSACLLFKKEDKPILRKGVGFAKYVSGLLEMEKYSLTEAEQQKLSLSAELEKFVGKPMFTRQEKEPFIQVMDVGRKKNG